MKKIIPSIQERLELDASSPSGLTWKMTSGRSKAGTHAGYLNHHGYWMVRLNGERYTSHRMVYFTINPDHDQNLEVDHINGNRSDNRIENLRLATASRQRFNRVQPNSTGFRWVQQVRTPSKTFMVDMQGARIFGFSTAEEAHAAALAKRKELGLPIDTRLSTVH